MYVGFRIWYADGSVKSNKDGTWAELPGDGVQFVTFYEDRTYQIWIETEWVTENYVVQLHGQDYYWMEGEEPRAGPASEAPTDPAPGVIKVGTEFEGFWELAAQAQTVRIAP